MKSLESTIDDALKEALRSEGPIWRDEYLPKKSEKDFDENLFCSKVAECCFRFVTECCWTYNESDGSIDLIPALEDGDYHYVRWVVNQYCTNSLEGGTLIIEKSRRLIMSWVASAIELFFMGLQREKNVIAGLNYSKSAEHVWRFYFLYNELRKRRPEFRLLPCSTMGGDVANQTLDKVILPNGSMVENLNQEGGSFQGSGFSRVRMEEFSQFKRCSYMLAQAKIVTQGKADSPGGSVVIISNSYPDQSWVDIKS